MECNIGAKGKAARLKLGLMALAGALALAIVILAGFVQGTIWWYGVAATTFGCLFTLWEARAGWCIVRAMGFKTPL